MDKIHIDKIKKEAGLRLYTTVTVGTKGQVVIPQEVRELLGIKPGDSLMVLTKDNVAIGMIKTDNVDELMEYMKKEHCNNN